MSLDLVLATHNPGKVEEFRAMLAEALPGVGAVRATAMMASCEISPARRLKGLGRRQREALIAYIGR